MMSIEARNLIFQMQIMKWYKPIVQNDGCKKKTDYDRSGDDFNKD